MIETCYDPAGRAISVTGKRGIEAQKAYVSLPAAPADAYWAHGAPKSLTFGNGVVETTDFNNQLQLRELTAKLGAANRLTLTYTFSTANNGNIAAQNIAGPGGSVLESYTYDALNRLKTYTRAGGGSQTYFYDAFGNRAVLGTSYIPVGALARGAKPSPSLPKRQLQLKTQQQVVGGTAGAGVDAATRSAQMEAQRRAEEERKRQQE